MCRAKIAPEGSKEDIKRLRKWSQQNKRWAQQMLTLNATETLDFTPALSLVNLTMIEGEY